MDNRERNTKVPHRLPRGSKRLGFSLLDCVSLVHDLPQFELLEGDVGTIVEVYKDGEAFEVEFNACGGYLAALLTMRPEDLRVPTADELKNPRKLRAAGYSGSAL
jgi:hypothetical protein